MPLNPDDLERMGDEITNEGLTPDDIEAMEFKQVTGPIETSIQAGQTATIDGLPTDEQALANGEMQIDGRQATATAAQKLFDRLTMESEQYLQQRLLMHRGRSPSGRC